MPERPWGLTGAGDERGKAGVSLQVFGLDG